MSCEIKTPTSGKLVGASARERDSETMGVSTVRERKAVYMKAYRQRPQVKKREQARKRTPEYKARQAEYVRDYKAWNRVRLSGYEQSRRAAVRQRELIATGEFGEVPRYSDSSIFQCGGRRAS